MRVSVGRARAGFNTFPLTGRSIFVNSVSWTASSSSRGWKPLRISAPCESRGQPFRRLRLQEPARERPRTDERSRAPTGRGDFQNNENPEFAPESGFLSNVPYVEIRQLFKIYQNINAFLGKRENLLFWGTCSLLLGAFSATSISTIVGAIAEWDPVAGAVIVIFMEWISILYYERPRPSNIIRILNAYKVGLTFGFILDALKLAG